MTQDPWQTPDQFPPPSPQQPPHYQAPPQPPTQPTQSSQPTGYPAAYPSYPSYPSYPAVAYGAPPSPRPPMPSTVRNAVNLMFAGAGLAVLQMIVGVAMVNSVVDHLRSIGTVDSTITSDKSAFIGLAVVGGLIGAGLWLWMALATRAGQGYARIVSSVFFGIGVIGLLGNISVSWVPALTRVLDLVELIIGLLAIVFVWNRQSGPYFNPPPTYPYGPYGGQQPPYGQPPYGQR